MANEKENTLPLDEQQTQQAPQAQTQTEQPRQEIIKPGKKAVDKSLVTASIKQLPPVLTPLACCFDNAWGSFVKAYGNNAGQVMAREIDFAAQALTKNNYLVKVACENPLSLVSALKNLALVGYTLNPVRKQCYLVPMGREVVFMPSYMGLVDELSMSGLVKKIEAHPVFNGESFEIRQGTNGGLFHKPNPWGNHDRENLLGCYWYAVLVDGTEMFDTISAEDIEKIRKRAPSAKSSSPWDTDYIEMARKGLALDTLIPTPNGFTTMGEIQVGDEVFNGLGEVTTVTSKSEVKHLPCYKVTFQNGDSFICDHEHRWFVSGTTYHIPGWHVGETKILAEVKKMGYPIVTPKIKAVELPERELPINPYVLGYWIGNGSRSGGQVVCDKKDADEIASYIRPYYDVARRDEKRNNSSVLNISCKGVRNAKTSLSCQLRELGEDKGKFIPTVYKRASISQRIELIQGLCDSDGCCHSATGRCSFGSVKEDITRDVAEILASLGERVVVTSRLAKGFGKEVMYYEVQWRPQINPFKLLRKSAKVRDRKLDVRHSIKSIEAVESVPTQCIAVDSFGANDEEDLRKSYAIGRGFYITHNTAIRNGYKKLPKKGISEDKLKVLDAMFDFDNKAEQLWIAEQKTSKPRRDPFDEDAEYEEISTE